MFKSSKAGLAALTLAGMLTVTACGSTKDSTDNESSSGSGAASSDSTPAAGGGEIKSGLKIAFLPKQINNPYFTISDKGGEDAVKALKGTFKRVGPSDATASSQVSYINTLTSQKVDAIAISANDPNAVVPSLKRAMSQGIKVVTYDSDTAPAGRDLFINQASAEGIAKVQVDMIADQIKDSGEIAILSASANATNQNAWIALMKKDLAADHPNIKLVDTVYGNDDDQTSFDKTAALLQTHPNLKGIISPTTVAIAVASLLNVTTIDACRWPIAAEITWLLVRTSPSLSITTPDPMPNCVGVLTAIDTTAGPTRLAMPATDVGGRDTGGWTCAMETSGRCSADDVLPLSTQPIAPPVPPASSATSRTVSSGKRPPPRPADRHGLEHRRPRAHRAAAAPEPGTSRSRPDGHRERGGVPRHPG